MLLDRELGWQYYRYRNYDPVVGRFWQVEPLVDSFGWWSGYGFALNRGIYAVELEGLEPIDFYAGKFLAQQLELTVMRVTEFSMDLGMAYGIGGYYYYGEAYDPIGYTIFRGGMLLYPGNQDIYDSSKEPKLIAGGGLSISGNVLLVNARTFQSAISKFQVSFYFGLKGLVGGNISIGKGVFGAGVGIGAEIKMMTSGSVVDVDWSLSLTYEEAEKYLFVGEFRRAVQIEPVLDGGEQMIVEIGGKRYKVGELISYWGMGADVMRLRVYQEIDEAGNAKSGWMSLSYLLARQRSEQ